MKKITDFTEKLNISFNDVSLLERAFTHRSYINENKGAGKHNERLEFLGDAVLELIVTKHLFNKYPDTQEGELTAYRSALVNTNSLADSADALGMGDYLRLSKGESKDTGKARYYILANTFEAFTGALFLDQGYVAAEEFVASVLFSKIDEIVDKKLWKDAKSFVQEKAQEIYRETPVYEIISEEGLDHEKKFVVGIYFGGNLQAKGEGTSKQEAEQIAAREALEANKWVE